MYYHNDHEYLLFPRYHVIQGLVAPLDCECVSDLYALCEGLRHLHHRVGTVRFAWVRRGLPAGIEGPLRVRARCSLVGALHSLEIACAVPACACWSPAVHILSFSCCVAREGRVHSAGQDFVGGERFEHPPLALSAKRCGLCLVEKTCAPRSACELAVSVYLPASVCSARAGLRRHCVALDLGGCARARLGGL